MQVSVLTVDCALAMEMGADGVLLNTAVSVKMAKAMKLAVEAGRLGYEAGRIPKMDAEVKAVRRRKNVNTIMERYSRQMLFSEIGEEGQKATG